jgi:hypothetical protein
LASKPGSHIEQKDGKNRRQKISLYCPFKEDLTSSTTNYFLKTHLHQEGKILTIFYGHFSATFGEIWQKFSYQFFPAYNFFAVPFELVSQYFGHLTTVVVAPPMIL